MPAKVQYTIERRYVGKLTGGLLDRWHAKWLNWHTHLRFANRSKCNRKLKELAKDKGWHVTNFEYRLGVLYDG